VVRAQESSLAGLGRTGRNRIWRTYHFRHDGPQPALDGKPVCFAICSDRWQERAAGAFSAAVPRLGRNPDLWPARFSGDAVLDVPFCFSAVGIHLAAGREIAHGDKHPDRSVSDPDSGLLCTRTGPVYFTGSVFIFEAYFAIAILGAQGLRLLARRSVTPRSAWITILAALVVMQAAQLAIASNVLLHSGIAYRRMEESTRHLTPTIGLVFFHGSESFVAMHFNLNEPDWRKASLVYLVGPSSAERSEWACRVGRPDWIVLELR
jgi:hypothetical protein